MRWAPRTCVVGVRCDPDPSIKRAPATWSGRPTAAPARDSSMSRAEQTPAGSSVTRRGQPRENLASGNQSVSRISRLFPKGDQFLQPMQVVIVM